MVQYRRQRKKVLLDSPLNRWLVWLDAGSPPDLIAEVLKMDSAIRAADKRLNIINKDKEFLRYYRLRQMALSDYTSNMNYARNEGRAEGIQQGRAEGIQQGRAEGMEQGIQQGRNEGILEIARKMKAMGDSVEKIQAITGLPIEAIERIRT